MWPSAVVSVVTIREIIFSTRSGYDSKFPAEIVLHSNDSDGKPRDPCSKHGSSREVNCCMFELRSFLGIHSR